MAFVQGYAIREVCSNGLIGKKLIGSKSRKHVGNWDSDQIAVEIKDIIPRAKTRLKQVIDDALNTELEYKYLEPVLMRYRLGKELSDLVKEKFAERTEIPIWEVYNAITTQIENEKQVKESIREQYHRKANKILTRTQEALKQQALQYIKENELEDEYEKITKNQQEIPEIIEGE